MAINITNRTNSPIGVWATPTEYNVIPAMNGATVENVTPTIQQQAIIDLLVKAGVVTASTYVPPEPPEDE